VGGTEAWAVGCGTAVEAYNKIKATTVKRAFVEAIGDLSTSICETAFNDKEKEKEKEEKERKERAKAVSEPFIAETDSIMSSFNSAELPRSC